MPIAFKITLQDNIDEIAQYFNTVKTKAMHIAAKRALNKGTRQQHVALRKFVQQTRKIKTKAYNKQAVFKRARGRFLSDLKAKITISGAPVPLIAFVTGKGTPRDQKNLTIKQRQRSSVTVQIIPGKKVKLQHAFIEKAKRGAFKYQIFKRKGSERGPWAMQSTTSLPVLMLQKPARMREIQSLTAFRIKKEFSRQFNLILTTAKPSKKLKVR